MSVLNRLFWWMTPFKEKHPPFLRLLAISLLWIWVALIVIPGTPYISFAALTVFAFSQISLELTQLARCELIYLLPGFERRLRTGLLTCIGILVLVAAGISPIYGGYMLVTSVFFVASVLSCLQLPEWALKARVSRTSIDENSTDILNLNWPSMAALAAPALSFQFFPERLVILSMTAGACMLLLALPKFLQFRPQSGNAKMHQSIWRSPGLLTFGITLILCLYMLERASDKTEAATHVALWGVIPLMGLTSANRQSQTLPALLGRMWLAGMDRVDLGWIVMRRLFFAIMGEYAIYALILVISMVLNPGHWRSLIDLLIVFCSFAWICWSRSVHSQLSNASNKSLAESTGFGWISKLAFLLLPVWAPVMLAGYAALPDHNGYVLWAGLFATLVLVFKCWAAWTEEHRPQNFLYPQKPWSIYRPAILNLPFLALLVLGFLGHAQSTLGLVATTLALASAVLTLFHFRRCFLVAELW